MIVSRLYDLRIQKGNNKLLVIFRSYRTLENLTTAQKIILIKQIKQFRKLSTQFNFLHCIPNQSYTICALSYLKIQ